MNGIELYHEISGDGSPLVLIHGGLTTGGTRSYPRRGWPSCRATATTIPLLARVPPIIQKFLADPLS